MCGVSADLERRISQRMSREDLIKRGVLKELDEGVPAEEAGGDVDLAEITEEPTG